MIILVKPEELNSLPKLSQHPDQLKQSPAEATTRRCTVNCENQAQRSSIITPHSFFLKSNQIRNRWSYDSVINGTRLMKTELVLWKFHILKVFHGGRAFSRFFASFRSSLQSVLRWLQEAAHRPYWMVTGRLDHEMFGMLNKAIEETAITCQPNILASTRRPNVVVRQSDKPSANDELHYLC